MKLFSHLEAYFGLPTRHNRLAEDDRLAAEARCDSERFSREVLALREQWIREDRSAAVRYPTAKES